MACDGRPHTTASAGCWSRGSTKIRSRPGNTTYLRLFLSSISSATFKILPATFSATSMSTSAAGASAPSSPATAGISQSGATQGSLLHGPVAVVTKPLPKVLILHTGGTLGMSPEAAISGGPGAQLPHTAASSPTLQPGDMLANLFRVVPELCQFANLDIHVLFNKDSSRVGPADWITMAKTLHEARRNYDSFLVVHGTDTMAYTASALSLMLQGFGKPIVLTGSQLPLSAARSDARQNLLDSIQCATASSSPPHPRFQEVAICFGGKLMRGNRTQKTNTSRYQAFDSLSMPPLAVLGIDVDWNMGALLKVEGSYQPRFKLDPNVIRVAVVPGPDPRVCYGDLVGRGVRAIVLETFGVGNLPDLVELGWVPWLEEQVAKGLRVCVNSQCSQGPLRPGAYAAGLWAADMGLEDVSAHMSPECSVVKLMLCLAFPDLSLGTPLAGEL